MRQAGILAAAGLYAIQNNIDRLQEDHDNAKWFADQLRLLAPLSKSESSVQQQTNMIFVSLPQGIPAPLSDFLSEKGVLIMAMNPLRLVVHKDVDRNDLERCVTIFQEALHVLE